MRPRCSCLLISLLVCCPFPLATRSGAQESPVSQEAAPTLQINVNRVLVPVVVRDKQGRPIADLKREDFEVVDNGKPRPVSAFNVEQRGPAEQHVDTGTAPSPASNATPYPNFRSCGGKFLFFSAGVVKSSLQTGAFDAGRKFQAEPLEQDGLVFGGPGHASLADRDARARGQDDVD